MSYIRVHNNKWQSIIRIKGHPSLAKSFKSKTDAKRWANETELKIRREDAGVVKIKYPSFILPMVSVAWGLFLNFLKKFFFFSKSIFQKI